MRPSALPLPLLFCAQVPVDGTLPVSGPGADGPGLVVDRGEEELGFVVPDHEILEFDVVVDMAVLGQTGLGTLELSAGTEEYRTSLASTEPGVPTGRKVGWIRARAWGSYLNYVLDHTIEARFLPQAWPRVIYRDTQQGSESRRRELMYGRRADQPTAWFRKDRHCNGCGRPEHFMSGTWPFSANHHCKKCKRRDHRLWREPVTNEIPAQAIDMLSAIHLARAMVREQRQEVTFPLLDKDRWWETTMTRAERRVIETPAGRFRCRAVKLSPKLPQGDEDEKRFRGLFGMHGTLSFWLEESTGVPVKIQGVIPVGPLDLDVSLRLRNYEGTPRGFEPAEE